VEAFCGIPITIALGTKNREFNVVARPKSFDRDMTIVDAMLLFWIKGYEATSVKDIEKATGLKTSSLYNTFGGKEQLFVISLKHYAEFIIDRRVKRYLTQNDPIKSNQINLRFLYDVFYRSSEATPRHPLIPS
jgi:AcrR family transcriptional regulator